MLNLFRTTVAYFFWCVKIPFLVVGNSIPRKYDNTPKSDISNSLIILFINSTISTSLLSVTNRSSKYRHSQWMRSCWVSNIKTMFSNAFYKILLHEKLCILLFQVWGACFTPYKAFLACTLCHLVLSLQIQVVDLHKLLLRAHLKRLTSHLIGKVTTPYS